MESNLQKAAAAVAVAFLLAGVGGFVPGITTNYDELEFAGHDSGALLLGIFEVSVVHNLVHLLFAAAGLAMARSWRGAKNYLIWGGLIYLALWVYGLTVDQDSTANFVPLNDADNWLHLALGVGMLALGFALAGAGERVEDDSYPGGRTGG